MGANCGLGVGTLGRIVSTNYSTSEVVIGAGVPIRPFFNLAGCT